MKKRALTIKLDVSRETLDRLEAFVALVEKWNPVINLVAKSSLSDIWHRHLEDSAQLVSMAQLGYYWIDIGSGGGFPGIVVAIILQEIAPATRVVLIESDVRKSTFLRQAVATLGLSCDIYNARIESLHLQRGATLSARALAPLPKLLALSESLVEEGGVCLLMKGQSYLHELADARRSWSFECDIIKSQTNADAAVLKIRNIQRAAE
jgi:16S rRNA (guanine527-N7)-methyltransferase